MSDRDRDDLPEGPEEPFPEGPNEDRSNQAAPPEEVEMPRTSDDDDLNPAGGGLRETPLRREYGTMARRDDLSRRLQDLVLDAREWAREDGAEEANDIARSLEDVLDRLGQPSEDTDTLGSDT